MDMKTPVKPATFGACLWLLWALATTPARTPLVTAFAPFVIIPLGLFVASRAHTGPRSDLLAKLGAIAPIIAISAALSFTTDVGAVAAIIAIPWFAFTIALAAIGVARILSRRTLFDPGISVDVALLFVAVGGAWLVISRAGLQPLGFSDRIVELTAMHFHFAGFALPAIAGAVASRLKRGPLLPAAVIVAVPITALGITLAGTAEWLSATFMATTGFVVAGSVLGLAQSVDGKPMVLLRIAGASLAAGMTLAIGWAWSAHFDWEYLDLDGMVATHGVLNGFGFSLLGLIGLCTLDDPSPDDVQRVCLHLGRPSKKHLSLLQAEAEQHDTTNPVGLLDRDIPAGFTRKVWQLPIEHGDFDRASAAITAWAGHRRAGINRIPEQPPIAVGQSLALAIPVGPISVSATARIIEVFDEQDRYGFTYSTLPHHPEDGEESFIVTRQPGGELEMVVTAVWRGAAVANHVLPPVTRFLQNQAIGRYLSGTAAFEPSTAASDLQLPA